MGEFCVVFQNEPVDVSEEFSKQQNHFFVGDRVEEFDPESASGRLCWKSFSPKQRVSYHQITTQLEDYRTWEDLPQGEYEDDRALPFDLSFVTPRTVRLRLAARPEGVRGEPTLMLEDEPPTDDSWRARDGAPSVANRGPCGTVIVEKNPVRFEFRDAAGGLLTSTHNLSDSSGVVNARPTPLSFVRNTATFHRHIATSFGLSPGEKLFGCGESPAGEVPVVMLVREGAAIPHVRLAQSTERIEWGEIELRVFGTGDSAEGYFYHPEVGGLHVLRLLRGGNGFDLGEDPLGGRVNWRISTAP